MEYKLGQLVKQGEKESLVTRVVNSEAYFFDHESKQAYILRELYLETLDAEGQIGFISISESREDVVCDPNAKIKGPDTLTWRKFMYQG